MKSILTRVATLVSTAAVTVAAWSAINGTLPAKPALAITPRQYACGSGFLSLTPASGYVPIPGARVTISGDDDQLRGVVVQLSADADVSSLAEMRSTFTVDGATPQDYAYGPGNFAENQEYWGARTIMNVIPDLSPGPHTIQAWVRISGGPSANGVVAGFCMTAEKKGSS